MSPAPVSPRYRNDTWSLEDGFGLGRAGDQVARMALEVDPPFTIGVTGKWGSGKTSVMRRAFFTLGGQPIKQPLVMAEAAGEDTGGDWSKWVHSDPGRLASLNWGPMIHGAAEGSLCVWYSPWQHQNEENPLVPLIREIQAQFTAWLKVKEKAKKFNRQAGLAVASLLERLTDAALTLVTQQNVQVAQGATEAVRAGWRAGDDGLNSISDGQRFHLLFEDAVQEVLKARGKGGNLAEGARLLIFVDDLDRCEGEVIVRLLEIIKLYLGTRYCVFVLGLDDGAVLDALRQHRSPSDEANREYLEKLFQATLAVPLPTCARVREGIERQLVSHGIPRDRNGPLETWVDTYTASSQLAQDIERLLEPNPRKIKNFVNSLCAAWGMHDCAAWVADAPGFPDEARRFVLLQYLRHYHRPVWRLLERQPRALGLLREVLGAEKSATDPGAATRFSDVGLLLEIFARAFSHILAPPDPDDHKALRHGNETLDQAVNTAIERRDRKRSDDNFRTLFLLLFDRDTSINERHIFLCLDTDNAEPARGPGQGGTGSDTPDAAPQP